MSNPEFKRNVWLSFSPHRLIAMPALLGLVFLTISLGETRAVADNLYMAFRWLFIAIVWLWGARNANAAVVDELRENTWDQQRMSALSPWTMTWGKLFGSTSFNWYGGILCLVVMIFSGYTANKPDVLTTALSLVATGVLLHAALIALNLHISQQELRSVQRGGIGWIFILMAFFYTPAFMTHSTQAIHWWGSEIDRALFWLDSSLLFAGCAIFAAWRAMCSTLQVRTLPWAWPSFALILAIYFAGFAQDSHNANLVWLLGLLISIIMTYLALFSEPNSLIRWKKLQMLYRRQDQRGWMEHLPLWPTTLVLSFVFAFLVILTAQDVATSPFSVYALRPPHALTLALMLLRDACIVLFFAFSHNTKRALGSAVLYLFVLNFLLPFFTSVAGLDLLNYFLLPFKATYDPWSSVLIMILHTAIALWMINWRLRNTPQT